MMKRILIGLFSITSVFSIFAFAEAQLDITGGANTLAIRLQPEHPRANEEVRAYLENYSFDLDRSNISWFLNGKIQAQGAGEKSISFN